MTTKTKTPSTMIERLKLAMRAKKITQAKLANVLGIHRSVVGRWYNETREISNNHCPAICEFLGISQDWLTYGSDDLDKIVVRDSDEIDLLLMYRLQTPEVQSNLMFFLFDWEKPKKNYNTPSSIRS